MVCGVGPIPNPVKRVTLAKAATLMGRRRGGRPETVSGLSERIGREGVEHVAGISKELVFRSYWQNLSTFSSAATPQNLRGWR